MPRPRREVSTERLLKDVRRVLEYPFWIPGVRTLVYYNRRHDDSDGNEREFISVMASPDGDIYVKINTKYQITESLRFRTYGGGGKSPRVHNALMILAEAIRLDNEEDPRHNPGH